MALKNLWELNRPGSDQIKIKGHSRDNLRNWPSRFSVAVRSARCLANCSLFAITLSLLAYGGYLAWENLTQVLQPTATPASTILAIVAMAIQVVVPLLPGLSYAVIYLSSRRDAPWFHRAGALCLLGLVTAAIEMLVHFIG